MKVLGVTGGIGSGKTTVCKIFSTIGIPVFYADEEAKLFLNSQEVIQLIRNEFGEEVFSNEKLNTRKLAQIVFKDESKLKLLNGFIHHRVKNAFEQWCLIQNAPYVIKEAAIMFESGSYKNCDWVCNVSCSKDERKKRVSKRDGRSDTEIEFIMSKQWTEEDRKKNADFIIENEFQKLIPQVLHLHETIVGGG